MEDAVSADQATERPPRTILVVSVGSRGDVQPYCALALALAQRGHTVSVATENRLRGLVEGFGLKFVEIYGDSTGVLHLPEAQPILQRGSMVGLMKLTKKWEKRFDKAKILESYKRAVDGVDIVVSGGLTMTQSLCAAESVGAAWLPLILGPTLPTSEFPLWPLKKLSVGKWMCGLHGASNRLTYWLAFNMLWSQEKKAINEWRRRDLNLPPLTDGPMGEITRRRTPVLIASSPLMCGPRHAVPDDYPNYAVVGGFVFVPSADNERIDSGLKDFIDKSSTGTHRHPVIYLGFGSMPAPDPSFLCRLAVDVCIKSRCHGVLAAGWSGLDSSECREILEEHRDIVYMVPSVPHDWLFPRMAAIIHHGGIGTTAAALRSGVPQVICPFMLDQPHNAEAMEEMGVSAGTVRYNHKINASTLASKIEDAISDVTIREMAANMGRIVREESEGSLERYCAIVESLGDSRR